MLFIAAVTCVFVVRAPFVNFQHSKVEISISLKRIIIIIMKRRDDGVRVISHYHLWLINPKLSDLSPSNLLAFQALSLPLSPGMMTAPMDG